MFYVVSIEVCNAGETREVVFVLEAGYPSLTALAEALRADGFIEGHRHNTRFGEGRRREVRCGLSLGFGLGRGERGRSVGP